MNKIENLSKYEGEITGSFPPVCPHCGSHMGWDSDFMLSEIGYIDSEDMMTEEELAEKTDENGFLIDDRVVHVFSCPHCGATADYEDLEDDGRMALLSVCLNSEDEEETEPDLQYSQFAQDKYDMPPFIE